MHHRPRAGPVADRPDRRRPLRRDPVQESHDLPHAHLQPMQVGQITLDAADRQAQDRAQMGYQARDAHPHAPLAEGVARQVERRFLPPMTRAAPAALHPMLRDNDGHRGRQVHHLPPAPHMHPAQPAAAVRTRRDRMLYHHRRLLAAPGVVVLRRPFPPRRARLCPRRHVGLHEVRWRRLLGFEFCDPLQRARQVLRQRLDLALQGRVLDLQGGVGFLCDHASTLTAEVKSELFRTMHFPWLARRKRLACHTRRTSRGTACSSARVARQARW